METLKLYRLCVVDHCGQIRMDISGSTHIFVRRHPRLLIFYGNQALGAQQREYTHQWLQQDSQTYAAICLAWECAHLLIMPDSVIPWTVARQAPLSMVFSKQENWSGLLRPAPGDFPDPGIQSESPGFPAWQGFFTTEPPGKPLQASLLGTICTQVQDERFFSSSIMLNKT